MPWISQATAKRVIPGESGPYDLLVLDLMLPKLDGQTLLIRFREQGHANAGLVLTARDEKQSVVRLLNAGADDYVAKPFDLGEFLARAKALVRRGTGQHVAGHCCRRPPFGYQSSAPCAGDNRISR